jgi:hypothetical protein
VSGWRRRLRRFLKAEEATSDVEYILLTATVVLPLFAVPPLLIDANVRFFDRVSFWVHLPFP